MKLIINFGLSKGIIYVKAILKRIEIQKEMFVSELLKGDAVYIPWDLSQDNLPWSFRFYDPIIQIIFQKSDKKSLS